MELLVQLACQEYGERLVTMVIVEHWVMLVYQVLRDKWDQVVIEEPRVLVDSRELTVHQDPLEYQAKLDQEVLLETQDQRGQVVQREIWGDLVSKVDLDLQVPQV